MPVHDPEETQVAVVIGRFQAGEAHHGHKSLIATAAEKHPHLLILLACKAVGVPADERDPLNYVARQRMMSAHFPDAIILPIHNRREDTDWSKDIDAAIWSAYPHMTATLYGGRDSSLSHYTGRHKTRLLDIGQESWSGTEARQQILDRPEFDDPQFRKGIIWQAASTPPRQDLAVDIALTRDRDGSTQLAIAMKKEDRGRCRFFGGFVERSDATLEDAAKRELAEESGLGTEAPLVYVGNRKIPDWRLRDSKTIIRSTLFHARYSFGSIDAQSDFDDVDSVEWVPFDVANDRAVAALRMNFVPEHHELFDLFVNYVRALTAPAPAIAYTESL